MPLGLVRLKTNSPEGKRRLVSANDVTHRKRVEDFGRFLKGQWVETRHWTKTVGFRKLAETIVASATRGGGGGADEKARIERLCLFPYVEEPLNSKVIKRFVPELRSRYMFFLEFRDPMFYVYM